MDKSSDLVEVIGAGVIGVGVAQVLATGGYRVVLVDISNERLASARQRLLDGVRAMRLFTTETATERSEAGRDRVTLTTSYQLSKPPNT